MKVTIDGRPDKGDQVPQIPEFYEVLRSVGVPEEGSFGLEITNDFALRRRFRGAARMYKRFCGSLHEVLQDVETDDPQPLIEAATHLAVTSLVNPPTGTEICPRNPKQEFPRLAKLVVEQDPISIVVPTCPDGNQYKLSDGIGTIGKKALDYATVVRELFMSCGFSNIVYDIQVADVEARDPTVLEASGETTESYFAKTAVTIRKIKEEAVRTGLSDFVTVSSMDQAFCDGGASYTMLQTEAALCINESDDMATQRVIGGLLEERRRLGDFDILNSELHRQTVVAELAGYSAYGSFIDGSAIIASPDAASAIPAYHFNIQAESGYSPVMYLRGRR